MPRAKRWKRPAEKPQPHGAPPHIQHVGQNVVARFEGTKAGDVIRLLCMSDVHFDSVYCERDLLKRHLDENPDTWIVLAGDLFDCMQGKWDRRRNYEELRPEYKGENYYDRVKQDAVSFFAPYARRILYVGYGNHETAILRNSSTDLLQRWVEAMAKESGVSLALGGFAGWLRIVMGRFDHARTWSHGVNIRVAHNGGGGGTSAPVTRGVIQTNRQAVFLCNADIVLNGDNHEGYIVPIRREMLLESGAVVQTVTWFLRTPGYKNPVTQRYGFDTEKIQTPKPLGCVLVDIRATMVQGERGIRDVEIVPRPLVE